MFIILFFVGRFFVFGKEEAGLFSGAVHLFWLSACKGKIIIRKTKWMKERGGGVANERRIYSPKGKIGLEITPVSSGTTCPESLAQYDRNIHAAYITCHNDIYNCILISLGQ